MAASSNTGSRRRRYIRHSCHELVALTPMRRAVLRFVGDYRLLSLPQLAALAAVSPKAARRCTRVLFDAGLIDVIPLPRVALAPPLAELGSEWLFGSAPNVFTLNRAGYRLLCEWGWEGPMPSPSRLGPRSTAFVGHELLVKDVRLYLELCARAYPTHRLERWREGGDAAIDLRRSVAPKVLRPDAQFVYRLGERALVGLVEADRGTERGALAWKQKCAAYERAFVEGHLQQATGFANIRVLVFAPTERRRDLLAELIRSEVKPTLASQFWLTTQEQTAHPALDRAVWCQPGNSAFRPLVPTGFIDPACPSCNHAP